MPSALPKVSVLVVEDVALIAMDIDALLEGAGYRVIGPASSVAAAFALLEKEKPDIALLDVGLGASNAFALVDTLVRKGIKVIFLSGHSKQALPEAHRHRKLIPKPFAPETVLRALKSELD